MKKKRELNLRYLLDMTQDDALGILTNNNDFTNGGVQTFDQEKDQFRKAQGHTGLVTYYEPIGKKFKLQVDYMYDYSVNQQNRLTKDVDVTTGLYTLRVDSLSNHFINTRNQNRAGLELWYETRKHTFRGGAAIRQVDIDNQNIETLATIDQSVQNILPRFTYRYNPSQAKRLTVRYRTNSQQPGISDLQPIPDNTNPNKFK